MSRSRVYLAAMGDVNDVRTWSGIPYHFLQSGQANGLIDEGLSLICEGSQWQRKRLAWNIWRWISGRGKGGFQYSVRFLEQLWQPVSKQLMDQVVINCFQLYPPSIVANHRVRKYFYIDMTLLQLFDFYELRSTVGAAIAREAIEREKQGYQSAELVVCHSQWAAQSVIKDYGVDPKKVRSIIPGANIDRGTYLDWFQRAKIPVLAPGLPLKLIFVGKYWDRKGLDRLLEALQVVHQQGRHPQLRVIGCRREELPKQLQATPGVEWLGFIDKRQESSKFMNLVAGADIGCLLSRAEAGGMVVREYHALGLVVLGTGVGGSPEHLFSDAGWAVSPSATAQEIANWLIDLIDKPSKYQPLRERAWQRRWEATWDNTVSQWRTLLA